MSSKRVAAANIGVVQPPVPGLTAPVALSNLQGATYHKYTLGTVNVTHGGTESMMGFGSTVAYTPTKTGTVQVWFNGQFAETSVVTHESDGYGRPFYGTGTAPANGAAVTGTSMSWSPALQSNWANATNAANTGSIVWEVLMGGWVTGLTLSTAYWFDATAVCGGAADGTIFNAAAMLVETI